MTSGPYPQSPGHKGSSDTGINAARNFASKAPPIRLQALDALKKGPASAEQIADELKLHFMIVRARLSELRASGLVEDSGQRGNGALGGKVIIWRLTTAEERALLAAYQAVDYEKRGSQ